MRITLLLLISCILICSLEGQSSDSLLLSVKGRYCNQHTAVGYGMIITFIDDPSKCDPVKGYVPIDDQIKHFKEALAAAVIDTHRFSKYSYAPQYYKSYPLSYASKNERKYFLSGLTPEEVRKVNSISRQYFVTIESTVLEYEDNQSQLDQAISAFNHTKTKAAKIAYALNMHVDKIIKIDDVYNAPPYKEVEGRFAYIDKHCYDLYVTYLLRNN